MRKQRHRNYAACPVEAALDLVGGKWKSVVLFRIMEQTRRFNELRRLVPNITQRMLTNQLRELEQDGLVHREVYPQVPPKVEYSLTELGQTLEPVLHALRDWGEAHAFSQRSKPATNGDSTTARGKS
ncbi:MAG: helix-turn-helix domain-containing protein [Pseudomonadota bacterium]